MINLIQSEPVSAGSTGAATTGGGASPRKSRPSISRITIVLEEIISIGVSLLHHHHLDNHLRDDEEHKKELASSHPVQHQGVLKGLTVRLQGGRWAKLLI